MCLGLITCTGGWLSGVDKNQPTSDDGQGAPGAGGDATCHVSCKLTSALSCPLSPVRRLCEDACLLYGFRLCIHHTLDSPLAHWFPAISQSLADVMPRRKYKRCTLFWLRGRLLAG